jgi:hypothetical protein
LGVENFVFYKNIFRGTTRAFHVDNRELLSEAADGVVYATAAPLHRIWGALLHLNIQIIFKIFLKVVSQPHLFHPDYNLVFLPSAKPVPDPARQQNNLEDSKEETVFLQPAFILRFQGSRGADIPQKRISMLCKLFGIFIFANMKYAKIITNYSK